MIIHTRKHTYKAGPNAGVTSEVYTVAANSGADQIQFCKTLGRDSYGVSWSSTHIVEVKTKQEAQDAAFHISSLSDGTITTMRYLATQGEQENQLSVWKSI